MAESHLNATALAQRPVVFFVSSVRPQVLGGGELWLIKTAIALQQRGYQVHLISYPQSLLIHEFEQAGLLVHGLKMGFDFNPLSMGKLWRLYRQYRPQAVFLNFAKDVSIAGVAARLANIPSIIFRNGYPILKPKRKHRCLLPFFDVILSNSHALVQQYAQYGWGLEDKITVIYNGLSTLPPPADYRVREPLTILGAGRLTDVKRFDQWVHIVAQLAKRYPITGIIAGEGGERDALQTLIDKLQAPIQLVGQLPSLSEVLQQADIFLHTAIREGMPNVVMESMAAGVPVVATNAGGTSELITHEQLGIVRNIDDLEGLQHAVEILIQNPQQRIDIAKQAQLHVREHFDFQRNIDRIEALIGQH